MINDTQQAQFTSLNAAADYLGNGAIEVPVFQREILDLVRRRGVLGQRIKYTPATGHPTRYFEQTAIPNNQAFSDPRTIAVTASNNTLRVENSANIRALTGQINFGLFDREVTQQQGLYTQLVAKDLEDMVSGMLFTEDKALWNGTAASLTDGSSVQYCGLQTQLTTTDTVVPNASIIDTIRTRVATMMASQQWNVKPTALYCSPLLVDLIEKEIKNAATTMREVPAGIAEVVPGLHVAQIMTAAGPLPLIPDFALGTGAGGSGYSATYYCAIVTEPLIEYHYVGDKSPRVFQMGLVSDLQQKFVAVKFGAIIAKGASYAHALVAVQR